MRRASKEYVNEPVTTVKWSSVHWGFSEKMYGTCFRTVPPGARKTKAFIHQVSHSPLIEGCMFNILVCTCLQFRQLLRYQRKPSERGLQNAENCPNSFFTSLKFLSLIGRARTQSHLLNYNIYRALTLCLVLIQVLSASTSYMFYSRNIPKQSSSLQIHFSISSMEHGGHLKLLPN